MVSGAFPSHLLYMAVDINNMLQYVWKCVVLWFACVFVCVSECECVCVYVCV